MEDVAVIFGVCTVVLTVLRRPIAVNAVAGMFQGLREAPQILLLYRSGYCTMKSSWIACPRITVG